MSGTRMDAARCNRRRGGRRRRPGVANGTLGARDATSELTDLTAVEAVAAMRRGDIAAEKYATALLARAERCKSLNAFISLDPDSVLEAARNADRARAPAPRWERCTACRFR